MSEHRWEIMSKDGEVWAECRQEAPERHTMGRSEIVTILNEHAALKRENNHKLQYLIEAVGEEYMPKKWAKEYRTLLGADDEGWRKESLASDARLREDGEG